MAGIVFTDEQRRAIETVDRSVLVSAAAGSGKTAVLAERCAHLVCDAPREFRCDVDRLLVVTFTEATAAEMKSRIRDALEQRAQARPTDRRLRAQTALLDTARISTLHAFCLWIVRRWFHRAGVDATVQLLDADEARLLRTETLDLLFDDCYAAKNESADRFRALVEDYGLGYDGSIAAFLLSLANFLTSLPDPKQWVADARNGSEPRLARMIQARDDALHQELVRQTQHCNDVAGQIDRTHRASAFYADLIGEHARQLEDWAARLAGGEEAETVRIEIADCKLGARGAPRVAADDDERVHQERDHARDLFNNIRSKLLIGRLQKRFCLFSESELRDGVGRVMPYISTLCDLVEAFQRRYDQAKRALGVVDFADLERLAYRLLTQQDDSQGENPVAVELRSRFSHVLVDEFQDINPLQAAILTLVSTEGIPERPDNLFVVGDVKQSIYRFRLAEAGMFLRREQRLDDPSHPGQCIRLQKNYRSTPTIINAINALFNRLMHEDTAGITYDDRARLQSPDPAAPVGPPVELHLLQGRIEPDRDEGTEPRFVDPADPAQWKAIEREAFLIAARIRQLIDDGFTIDTNEGTRPMEHRDVCVLLRSVRQNAEPLAHMLGTMGIPARADLAGGLFAAMEVRDVLALLQVLDNVQQDIPLAAVLRSGILDERLNEDELATVRACDRAGTFHEAVRAYARTGKEPDLRDKLARLMARIERYRQEASMRPLADVLWMIYSQTGYLAYVGGLAGGPQRRANLLALHERARQFGRFQRQGLRRFLNFIEALVEQGDDLGAPSPASQSDDVVRIMSIHKAKGLEFPVVFVAELGRRFNLTDTIGRFLFDREVGIGIKAVDRERLIEYPTGLHQWCARATEEACRAEEMRVLYVAATRARDKLILIGTEQAAKIRQLRALASEDRDRAGALVVLTAGSPLHWIVTALSGLSRDEVCWSAPNASRGSELFHVTTHNENAIRGWAVPGPAADESAGLLEAVAALEPLPSGEPVNTEPQERAKADRIIAQLDYTYPHLGVSSVRVAWAASEPKRAHLDVAGAAIDEPFSERPQPAHPGWGTPPQPAHPSGSGSDAIERGRTVHSVLQFIDLGQTLDAASVTREVQRMVAAGIIKEEAAGLVDVDALVWFFETSLGQRIRSAGSRYHREWMFLSTEAVDVFDPTVVGAADDRVLVRGVADGVLCTNGSTEVVDFKTDRVGADRVEARAGEYAIQMQLYGAAVAEVFQKPVKACHLVFLHCRRIVELPGTEP